MTAERLQSVQAVRAHQREWLAQTREHVKGGAPFVICNGDEAEELCSHFDIPVLVINYWNSLISIQQMAGHYRKVLHERGYPGNHYFALSYASSLEPEHAPWGGIPKPSLIVGSGRWESELRITELWARHYACDFFPMDFNMSPPLGEIPERWWEMTRRRWRELVNERRLAERAVQEYALMQRFEDISGRKFDRERFNHSLELLNQQMDEWETAQAIIGATRPCPVSVRDQMSMYQAMWHRGTEPGLALVRAYRQEVEDRARAGVGCAVTENFRLFYNAQTAPWESEMEERFGAVTVACSYAGIPGLYARDVYDGDGLTALAARHQFLFHYTAQWMLHNANRHQCDAIIAHEAHQQACPSIESRLCARAGIPYLALPGGLEPAGEAKMVAAFIEDQLIGRPGR